ncbi:CHAT domain-containing protein [Rhodopirellula sp. MGV]|uniref:CHAT domain-containing protein n=1 Tax=Rhodopirellula sp. MGV TaxID=2023130 RepID=UPI000B9642F3|nr:CHAT domain-containing protein [Rhodopirellula sp. MGV]OYP35376.1 hypothetical protein CGZ80_11950 [Rhodopirellula sp. MGV]PNY37736.1 CHAT domain-containing protein [Rhodopirellula baltica]
MPDPKRIKSTDFIICEASDSYENIIDRLENSAATWVLLSNDSFSTRNFSIVARAKLLDLLRRFVDGDFSKTVGQLLDLREADSNPQLVDGKIRFAGRHSMSFDGRFANGVVSVRDEVPDAIQFPPVAHAGPRSGSEGALESIQGPTPMDSLVSCDLGASFPDEIVAGQSETLEVCLSAEGAFLEGATTKTELSPNEKVIVQVKVSRNLVLDEPDLEKQEIDVPTNPNNPKCLAYDITALPLSEQNPAGQGRINVRLFQPSSGAEIRGSLKLHPDVVSVPTGNTSLLNVAGSTLPPSRFDEPDITIFIEERAVESELEIQFSYSDSTHLNAPLGYKRIKSVAADYFKEQFRAIEESNLLDDADAMVLDNRLRSKGVEFSKDLLSAEMRSLLNERGDEIQTIQVITGTHHIPWEMVSVPSGNLGDRTLLAERFAVTRWTEGVRPPEAINVKEILYCAPIYEESRQLKYVDDEIAMIKSLTKFGCKPQEITPAHTQPVIASLGRKDPGIGLFHFMGHANAAGRTFGEPVLQLETEKNVQYGSYTKDKVHRLLPTDVASLGSVWATERPFIFLNACQTGQATQSLTGYKAWASALQNANAGAIICTLWSVRDNAAHLFSETLYRELLQNKKKLGESVLLARQAVAKTNDPSWLAYVVYGHPNTRCVVE